MTKAYLNYPNPHVTIHGDQNCGEIQKMKKPNQRDVVINQSVASQVFAQITLSSFRLGADASINDIWLTVDFGDREFEEAVVRYIHRLLQHRYSRLANSVVTKHC